MAGVCLNTLTALAGQSRFDLAMGFLLPRWRHGPQWPRSELGEVSELRPPERAVLASGLHTVSHSVPLLLWPGMAVPEGTAIVTCQGGRPHVNRASPKEAASLCPVCP